MTTILDVTIPGDPRGYQRPGVAVRGGFAKLYEQKETRDWRAVAADIVHQRANGKRVEDEPVSVLVQAVGKRPKSLPKRHGVGRLWRITKPDADNVAKAVCDTLVQSGLLRDDTLIATLIVHSLVAADGEAPHVRVTVCMMEPIQVVPWPAKTKAK
jgi:Holliday junction resolvase RusA-like endonuclease